MVAPLRLPRYYREPETGDYLMAYEAYRQPHGYKYAVRATAIAGDIGSLTTLDVAGAYLRRCHVVPPEELPNPWRQAFDWFLTPDDQAS
jgi:hypothetical protein